MKLVKINDLFEIKNGNGFELINMEETEPNEIYTCNFISRTEKNNGISARVEMTDIDPFPANTISVAVGGSVLATFLQSEPYYTGFHIQVLIPKKEYTQIEMLFYAYCIRQNKYRYNYGRQANKTLKNIEIPETMPKEWQYLSVEKINTLKKEPILDKKIELGVARWKYFETNEIFNNIEIAKSTDLNTLEEVENGVPYVGRSRDRNGVTSFIEDGYFINELKSKGQCLTVAMVGDSTCSTFWQEKDFIASQNIMILRSKEMNKYTSLFISQIIYAEKYRFSYGRTLSKTNFENTPLKLPTTPQGQPDWQFMEDYIKSLPYSKSI
jgi:hypothetical protein